MPLRRVMFIEVVTCNKEGEKIRMVVNMNKVAYLVKNRNGNAILHFSKKDFDWIITDNTYDSIIKKIEGEIL